jgi:hypothetical protein
LIACEKSGAHHGNGDYKEFKGEEWEEEVSNVGFFQGHIGWRVIAEIVAGGPGRVRPVNRLTIAKFVMSTDSEQYTTTKLQPTLTPFHKE